MLPSLKVKIGADTSDLDKGLNKTRANLLKFAKIAAAAMAAVGAATAALTVKSMRAVDAQAKLAKSLNTTAKSIQVLDRAGELAGVSMGEIQQATIQLTKRLSQATMGAGPAAKALKKLGLSANDLSVLPLDEKISKIQDAIQEFIPAAQQAAISSELFGDRAGLIFTRIDSETLSQAAQDIKDFGVGISQVDAANIETANDAISRLKLITTGFGNLMAAKLAPAIEGFANAIAEAMKMTSPFRQVLNEIFARIPAYTATILAFASAIGVKMVAALAVAKIAALGFAGSLRVLRGALISTGIGALVVLAGEAVFWFQKLVEKTGGLGEAMMLLGEVWRGVWSGIVTATQAVPAGLSAVWAAIKAGFYSMLEGLSDRWYKFISTLASGTANITVGGMQLMPEVVAGLDRAAQSAADTMSKFNTEAAKADNEAKKLAKTASGKLTEGAAEAAAAFKKLKTAVAGVSGDEEGPSIDPTVVKNLMDIGKAAGATKEDIDGLTEAQRELKSASESVGDAFGSAFTSMIDGTKKAGAAFKDMARAIINDLFKIFVVKRITGFIANTIESIVGVPAAAATPALNTYDGGGFTGAGSRTGGVDGKGGFPAILHPNETVIDHTKGQNIGGGGVTVIQNNNFESGVSRAEISAMIPRIVDTTKQAVFDAQRRSVSGRGYA